MIQFSEIEFSEIQPGDLLKVLVNIDDVEDEQYARVEENRDDYLIILYYSESSFSYKRAPVYTLDEETNLIRGDSILEHHACRDNVFTCVNDVDRMYVITSEQDSEVESVLCDESDEDISSTDTFIVSDSEIECIELPPDHETIDRQWNEWQPRSPGSTRFKQTVDAIEEKARLQMDEVNF